jgi:hypothetical protein
LTFAAILPGQNDRFSVMKRLVDRSPYGTMTALSVEIFCENQVGIGMSWAHSDASFVLSIGHTAPWSDIAIAAERHSLDEAGALLSTPVHIDNLATPDHARNLRLRIVDYGRDIASSSIVFRCDHYVIRMFLLDHGFPHVHVYPRPDDTHDLMAKIRVDTRDLLEGQLSSAERREIMPLLERNRNTLLEGWRRCRAGQLPLQIE